MAIERQTEVCELVLPARTQPNMVSKAIGEPGGPDRWPYIGVDINSQ